MDNTRYGVFTLLEKTETAHRFLTKVAIRTCRLLRNYCWGNCNAGTYAYLCMAGNRAIHTPNAVVEPLFEPDHHHGSMLKFHSNHGRG